MGPDRRPRSLPAAPLVGVPNGASHLPTDPAIDAMAGILLFKAYNNFES